MPELPDVAVFTNRLNRSALRRKINAVEVNQADLLKGVSRRKLSNAIRNHSMEKAKRHGKHLLAYLDNGAVVVLHFGMTGSLEFIGEEESLPQHAALVFHFDDGCALTFQSVRRLGEIRLAPNEDAFFRQAKFGPDALAISRSDFVDALTSSSKSLKSFLTHQATIAGIGNVYGDEILFQSDLHPNRRGRDLSTREASSLYSAMQRVLKLAIRKHADPDKFPNGYLTPHRGEGEKCPRCGGSIRKYKQAGRTGYYCPSHQKE